MVIDHESREDIYQRGYDDGATEIRWMFIIQILGGAVLGWILKGYFG